MGNYFNRFCGGANSHSELDVYSIPPAQTGSKNRPVVLFEGFIRIQKMDRSQSKSFVMDQAMKLQMDPNLAAKVPESAEVAGDQQNLIQQNILKNKKLEVSSGVKEQSFAFEVDGEDAKDK